MILDDLQEESNTWGSYQLPNLIATYSSSQKVFHCAYFCCDQYNPFLEICFKPLHKNDSGLFWDE